MFYKMLEQHKANNMSSKFVIAIPLLIVDKFVSAQIFDIEQCSEIIEYNGNT